MALRFRDIWIEALNLRFFGKAAYLLFPPVSGVNKESTERTTIEIDVVTRRRLRVWKAERDMTYSDAVTALLNSWEESEANRGGA